MKTRLTRRVKILYALIFVLAMFFSNKAQSGEFLIMNGTYTFTADNGGMFANAVYPPFNSNIPTNWLSPDDYWNGSFHAYYEVLSVPTDEPFGFQMGIFQYIYPNDGKNFRETCSAIAPLQGVGSWIDYNYGAPATWWQHPNGAADFSRPYDFQSIGPCIWSLVPGAKGGLYPTAWGGDDAAWALRANWFPCTVRIIIVAVSAGSTFSGWSNYMGGCSTPAQPGTISGNTTPTQGSSQTYSISAVSGATSYTWSLPSGWTGSSTSTSITTTVGSTGGTISVTANNSCGSSTARTLSVSVGGCSVPDQPGAITGNINPTQGSSQTYSISDVSGATSYTWSLPSGWTGTSATSSINTTVGINGGTISVTANNTCGPSIAKTLSVSVGCDNPSQQPVPTYGIYYGGEVTNKVVPTTDEYSYSSNMSSPVNGSGQVVPLTPGQDVYFRTKSDGCNTASAIQHLIVPVRPSMPTFSIDYINETTGENVGTTIFYTPNSNYTNPVSGTGEKISLTPGQDLYLWVKSTASSFASMDYHLDVPSRPATPAINIDFATEHTSAIPSTQEWSTSAAMTSATAGTNAPISVAPGTDFYFRTKATASGFKSLVQSLDVPSRPATPSFSVDFINEKTAENVSSAISYSTSPSYTNPVNGAGVKITLTPGQDLYLWVKQTASSFASMDYHLVVPARPSLVYTGAATVTDPTITMYAVLDAGMTGFDLTDLAVTNGTAQNLRGNNTFDVIGIARGDVKVNIPYNKFGGASFKSNEISVYYDKTVTGIPEIEKDNFIVYPNPANNGILFLKTTGKLPSKIDLLSENGSYIRSIAVQNADSQQFNLQDLPNGIYLLKIYTDDHISMQKLIKE